MARALAKNPLLLGYPDEEITEEYLAQVDFCASKIGGTFSNKLKNLKNKSNLKKLCHFTFLGLPNWICSDVPSSELTCQLCQSPSQLICQIYAPLENSPFHRTLYVFACIQPPCWNDSKSWKCFRGQVKSNDKPNSGN